MSTLVTPDKPASVAIVGGGPSGLFAAETLLQAGIRVVLYDRMASLGRKFLMAGRGGLNLTHSEVLPRFLQRYGPTPALLGQAIEAFPPDQLREWAHGLGQQTYIGSSGRVFPEAMKASPLLRAWLRRLTGLGLETRLRHEWTGLADGNGLRFRTPDGEVIARHSATLLALGGASWPRLGADGSWVAPVQAAGLPVTPLTPSNVGIRVDWSPHMERVAGQPLKRMIARFAGREVPGEAIITRQGLEGGVIYALSRALRAALATGDPVVLELDLRPDFQSDFIARRLREGRSKDSWTSRLRKAAGLQPAAVAVLVEAGRRLGLANGDIEAWARLVRSVPVTVQGLCGLDRAISTAGGLSFDALDRNWMLAERPGLFASGEMLDWDAPTGGYLLQACFASGRAAALGILNVLAGQN